MNLTERVRKCVRFFISSSVFSSGILQFSFDEFLGDVIGRPVGQDKKHRSRVIVENVGFVQ